MIKNSIIYDGACGFCNKTILFIAKNDTSNYFTFISSLSQKGCDFLVLNKLVEVSRQSIIVIDNGIISTHGLAIKTIFKNINANYILRKIIFYSNLPILNFGYSIISKYRLRFTNNICEIPPKDILSKFELI